MPFKLNVSEKGKTYKLETESEELVGEKIGDKLKGEKISSDLTGYELEITGTSDIAGFPGLKDEEGPRLRKKILTYGPGLKKRPKGDKKKNKKPKGLRFKKTIRGNQISKDTAQINLKVIKSGEKKLEELFGKKEQPAEQVEEKKEGEKKQEVKEKKEEQ